jgi:uncharacterized protein YabN with tetrapyrrole methylase and pyrophosphatase domain
MKGSLHLVGTGFNVAGQMTPEALACVNSADLVYSLLGDPASKEWLRRIRPDAQSLIPLYAEGKPRLQTYAEMADEMLSPVREGITVCVALYGHPGVFVNPSHAAVRQAAQEGLSAKMYPGVSAESCLFADLGVDPVARGCQSFEATDFLVRNRVIDTASSLILWQIGSVGVSTYYKKAFWSQDGLEILVDRMLEEFPPDHKVVIYEASPFPVCEPRIDTVQLKDLPTSDVSIISTLFVPPLLPAAVDEGMLGRLQDILGSKACPQAPFGQHLNILPPKPEALSGEGQLTVVGLGYGLAGQVTADARFHMEKADKLFYLVSDPVSSSWLRNIRPDAESLHHLYGVNSDSAVFSGQMSETMLEPVREGQRVCVAFTGHPAIVVPPAINAIRQAREEGFRAEMLPSISIEDCLVAELGVDPGVNGRQFYDATDFVLRPRKVDTSSTLILIQAGTLGEQLYRSEHKGNPKVLELLLEILLKHYPEDHPVIIYETPQIPLGEVKKIQIAKPSVQDEARMQQLGLA